MSRSMGSVSLEGAFFPVSSVRLSRSDTGEGLRRHWAVVPDDRNEVFAVVTQSYRLVSNEEACQLGHQAFALIFGEKATEELRPFNVIMPKTRSWVLIDFTADCLAFNALGDDRWVPFLRVTNSYNRTKALQFTVGVCRWICKNGMIFGAQSLTLRNTHQQGADLAAMVAGVFAKQGVQFDAPAVKDSIARLAELKILKDQFLAGALEVLGFRVPDKIPPSALHAVGWPELGPHLTKLARRYADEFGCNAYALVNAVTDYASDLDAPRMNAPMANTLQSRCGRWAENIALRHQEVSSDAVEFTPGSMAAATRLMSFATKNWDAAIQT
jgi:hypothetical protein